MSEDHKQLRPKKRYLTIEKKMKMIENYENGASKSLLAFSNGVHRSSVSRLIKNKETIKRQYNTFCEAGGCGEKRQRFTGSEDSAFEIALYAWFKQKRNLGEIVTGPQLKQKALEYHVKINGPSKFTASDGWLSRFKDRHGIRCLDSKGLNEKISAESATMFRDDLNMFLQSNGYKPDNIYIADEAGLQYQELPNEIDASDDKEDSSTKRKTNQRVTVLVCTNATGTHKIPLLVIGCSSKPRCFKNVQNLPVNYTSQRRACINQTILLDWYKNNFIPEVKSKKIDENERFVLLLNNTPSNPSTEDFDQVDKQFKMLYLPPYLTSLLQVPDQGVITALKRNYRQLYLQELVNKDGFNEKGNDKLTSWSLLNCVDALFVAWENVSRETCKNDWKNIVNLPGEIRTSEETQTKDLVRLMNQLPRKVDFSEEDGYNFVNCDNDVSTWKKMTDDEILNQYGGLKFEVNEDEIDNEDYRSDDNEFPVTTTSEAIKALTTVLNWCKSLDAQEISQEEYEVLLRLRYKAINMNIREKTKA